MQWADAKQAAAQDKTGKARAGHAGHGDEPANIGGPAAAAGKRNRRVVNYNEVEAYKNEARQLKRPARVML